MNRKLVIETTETCYDCGWRAGNYCSQFCGIVVQRGMQYEPCDRCEDAASMWTELESEIARLRAELAEYKVQEGDHK